MSRAYLLVLIPAALVGVLYVAVFHAMGAELKLAPFLGAALAVAAAVLIVRHYQKRPPKRRRT